MAISLPLNPVGTLKAMVRWCALVSCVLCLSNCATTQTRNGNYISPQIYERVKISGTPRDAVEALIGVPTASGPFDNRHSIYVGELRQRRLFFPTRLVERSVVIISFDEEQRVRSARRQHFENPDKVDFESDFTSTEEVSVGILRSIFGGVGGVYGGQAQQP